MLRARIIAPGGSDNTGASVMIGRKFASAASQPPFSGAADWPSRASAATPDLLRTNLPTARDLRYRRARLPRLGDNPALLFRRPTPSPRRSRQHLNPTEGTLRVVVNYVHKNRSIDKPHADQALSPRHQQKGRQASLTEILLR